MAKKGKSGKLSIVNKELTFLNEEREKCAAELIFANKELEVLVAEKRKRSAELVIANKELAFQDKEKENRAKELIIANKVILDYKYALDVSSIIVITDQEGIITHVNDNFCKISKYCREELIGQDHRIINSGYHSKEFIRNLWTTIAHGKIWKGDLRNKAKDGSFYWINDTIIPFLKEKGKPYQYVAIQADITKQKNVEEEKTKMIDEIIQRNRNFEQFSYIVSHNLRSPVANILGLTNLLQEENMLTETAKYLNNGLNLSASKLDEVIKDLNYILRIKQNVTEKKELVNFSNLASDIHLSIEAMIAQEKATINCDFSEVTEMRAIKSYLYSIFYNIISNSVKYRQPNVPLLIEIKSQVINNKIILLFKDNGLGIDLERQKDSVFGLYKRFHKDHAEGKGMGLYMVKTQVESMGGSISIKSQINKGTKFIIEFSI